MTTRVRAEFIALSKKSDLVKKLSEDQAKGLPREGIEATLNLMYTSLNDEGKTDFVDKLSLAQIQNVFSGLPEVGTGKRLSQKKFVEYLSDIQIENIRGAADETIDVATRNDILTFKGRGGVRQKRQRAPEVKVEQMLKETLGADVAKDIDAYYDPTMPEGQVRYTPDPDDAGKLQLSYGPKSNEQNIQWHVEHLDTLLQYNDNPGVGVLLPALSTPEAITLLEFDKHEKLIEKAQAVIDDDSGEYTAADKAMAEENLAFYEQEQAEIMERISSEEHSHQLDAEGRRYVAGICLGKPKTFSPEAAVDDDSHTNINRYIPASVGEAGAEHEMFTTDTIAEMLLESDGQQQSFIDKWLKPQIGDEDEIAEILTDAASIAVAKMKSRISDDSREAITLNGPLQTLLYEINKVETTGNLYQGPDIGGLSADFINEIASDPVESDSDELDPVEQLPKPPNKVELDNYLNFADSLTAKYSKVLWGRFQIQGPPEELVVPYSVEDFGAKSIPLPSDAEGRKEYVKNIVEDLGFKVTTKDDGLDYFSGKGIENPIKLTVVNLSEAGRNGQYDAFGKELSISPASSDFNFKAEDPAEQANLNILIRVMVASTIIHEISHAKQAEGKYFRPIFNKLGSLEFASHWQQQQFITDWLKRHADEKGIKYSTIPPKLMQFESLYLNKLESELKETEDKKLNDKRSYLDFLLFKYHEFN